MKKWIKWASVILLAVIIFVYGFSFTVREGSYAIISRFGSVRKTCEQAGLYLKLPAPFEKVIVFDAKSQYMDSGYTETLTNDKKISSCRPTLSGTSATRFSFTGAWAI